MSSTVAATTVASIVGGETRRDAPGGRLTSTNPARLDDVVAEALLGDASTFVDAARAAREAQKAWARVPPPARARGIAQVGGAGGWGGARDGAGRAAGGGQQGGAGFPGHARDRQAVP